MGVGPLTQLLQFLAFVRRDNFGGTEAPEEGAGLIEAALHVPGAVWVCGDFLLPQADHRLEQVVVDPHFVAELLEQQGLRHRVEALMAEESADLGKVLLFYEAIVILVKRTAT